MKRTLKRELKVLEIAKREALETSDTLSQSLSSPTELVCVVGNSACVIERVVGEFMIWCQSRSVRIVGEGSEEGRWAITVIVYCSTSAWTEEVMVRRLRLGPVLLCVPMCV